MCHWNILIVYWMKLNDVQVIYKHVCYLLFYFYII